MQLEIVVGWFVRSVVSTIVLLMTVKNVYHGFLDMDFVLLK